MSIVADNMNEIKNMDTEPAIFKVFLIACDYMEGFEAWVDFRRGHGEDSVSHVSARSNTPEGALSALRHILIDKFLIEKAI
jgi:hypothetical protein